MKKLINIKETLDKQSTQIAKTGIYGKQHSIPGAKLVEIAKECGASLEELAKTINAIPPSKRQQIHDYLKLGFGLTKLDCLMMFGYINLGDYVYVLRKKYGDDYIINKKLRNYKTGAKYVSYMINEKYLK